MEILTYHSWFAIDTGSVLRLLQLLLLLHKSTASAGLVFPCENMNHPSSNCRDAMTTGSYRNPHQELWSVSASTITKILHHHSHVLVISDMDPWVDHLIAKLTEQSWSGNMIYISCNTTGVNLKPLDHLFPTEGQHLLPIVVYCPDYNLTMLSLQVQAQLAGTQNINILSRHVIHWIFLTSLKEPSVDLVTNVGNILLGADTITELYFFSSLKQVYKIENVYVMQWKLDREKTLLTLADAVSTSNKSDSFWTSLVPSKFYGFNGATLTVGTYHYPPFSYRGEDDRHEWKYGLSIEFLQLIAQKYNFSCEFITPRDWSFGARRSDGTWTGLVGMLLEGKIDLIVTGLTISKERREVIDFTYPFWQEYLGMMIYVSPKQTDWIEFLRPFHWQVWYLYLGASLVTCAALVFLSQPLEKLFAWMHIADLFSQAEDTVLFIVGAVWNQGGVFHSKNSRARFLISFFWFGIICIVAAYSGNLIASLATQKLSLPFRTLNELIQQRDYKLMYNKGDIFEVILQESLTGVYHNIKSNKLAIQTPKRDLYETLQENKYALVGDWTSLTYRSHQQNGCEYVVLPEHFFPSGFGIGLPKGSPFNELFSQVILDMLELGLDIKWKEKYWPQDKCKSRTQVATSARPVMIQDLAGIFMVWHIGTMLALFILIIERLIYSFSHNMNTYRHNE